jgi:competence transcription factor ComK
MRPIRPLLRDISASETILFINNQNLKLKSHLDMFSTLIRRTKLRASIFPSMVNMEPDGPGKFVRFTSERAPTK